MKFLLLIMISTLFIGCSKDEGGGAPAAPVVVGGLAVPANLANEVNQVQGDWKINENYVKNLTTNEEYIFEAPFKVKNQERSESFNLRYRITGMNIEIRRIYSNKEEVRVNYQIGEKCFQDSYNCLTIRNNSQVVGEIYQQGNDIVFNYIKYRGEDALYGTR